MKTAREIRTEIANSFDIPVEKVAYNNGGVLTSVCSSQCRMRKRKTDSYQFTPRKGNLKWKSVLFLGLNGIAPIAKMGFVN